MNLQLMREYEEFEGLGNQVVDDTAGAQENEDDDPTFRPQQASELTSNEIYYQLDKRNLKTTGFPDTDRDLLQRVFNEEFQNELEDLRARRREKQRKAAQQLGLQRRRMMMEKTLQEEQDELAKSHQVSLMIDQVKDNLVRPSLRIEVNSVTARSLAKAMWVNDTITCLDLSSLDLNDHAGCYLARILKHNNTLKKIELDNNKLGSKACQAFGESLLVNTSLKYLSLDSNQIASYQDMNGLKALAEGLRTNNTLTSLNLWRCGINIGGGSILAGGIEDNDSILFCDIGHNNIEIGDVKRIVDKLDSNLAAYEREERRRRQDAVEEGDRQKKVEAVKEAETKSSEQSKWLEERRSIRAEDRRQLEQQRIIRMQEEMEEKKRLADLRKEEERKAAEEAAAKKAKKKDKKGKK